MNGMNEWMMQANEQQCLNELLAQPEEEAALTLTGAQALQLLETLITMDYPVLNRDVSLCGVRAVQAYLDGLELEQEFLHLFPEPLAVCME